MTIFLRAANSGGMLGNMFPANRNNLRLQHADYSTRWWDLGPDVLWTRSMFVGAPSAFGSYFCDMNNSRDIWDWELFVSAEGKSGQRRDGITGVTRDSTGATLGSVTVKAFDLARDLIVDTVTSDANGNFTVTTPYTGQQIYCVAYKAGTPVYGATAILTPA